jgi:hypothetical protein
MKPGLHAYAARSSGSGTGLDASSHGFGTGSQGPCQRSLKSRPVSLLEK